MDDKLKKASLITKPKNLHQSKPLHICFIAGTLGQGGAERQLYYYLKTLVENDYRVHILCLTKGDYWEESISKMSIPITWVGKHKNPIIRLFTIIHTLKKNPPDIIYSQHFHSNFYCAIAGKILDITSIGSLRNDVFSEIAAIGSLGNQCLLLPDYLVANSQAAITNAVYLGRHKESIFFLPNVVDEQHFVKSNKKTGEGNFTVVSVGTLWEPKRFDRVVRTARRCLDQNLKIEFELYGDGIAKSELIHLAQNLGVYQVNLRFMGSIKDAKAAYENGDILLLTSDHEGTPNVVLEAMACGLPVISTRVGDVPDLIVDGVNGFVTDLDDEEALFDRLKELYENQSLRLEMGNSNREKIIKERSFQNLYKFLEILYGQMEIN